LTRTGTHLRIKSEGMLRSKTLQITIPSPPDWGRDL